MKKMTHCILHFAATLSMLLIGAGARAEEILGQPLPKQIGMQAAASPTKEKITAFHDVLLMPIITAITIFVFILLLIIIVRFNAKANPTPSKTTHNTMLEVVWTLVPVLILVAIAIPSMKLLYYADKTVDAEMTLKAIGNQWYWGYEYPDHGVSLTANMIPDAEIKEGQVRLLSTDNPVVLPVDTNIRILTTANDVIHAWTVPAFGVKIDAVPGRLNETWVRITKEGTYFGQCSEICGINHAFMPIEIKAVSKSAFARWVKTQGGKMPEAASNDIPPAPVALQETSTEETGE